MAKRKKAKRRAPKQEARESTSPAEEDEQERELDAAEEAEAAAPEAGEDVEPESPAAGDPSAESPDGPVAEGGGLWVMAVLFGLIAIAVAVQFFFD